MPGPEISEATKPAGLVDSLIARARSLDDVDLQVLAEARAGIDETFHRGAWRAALEALSTGSSVYAEAWTKIGDAYVPRRLEELAQRGGGADRGDLVAWQQVARLARLAIDDALLALLTADTIPPPHRRELMLAWQAMLRAAHDRTGAED